MPADPSAILRAADPSALLLRTLSGDSGLRAALGGADRVGGSNAPPYPRLLVTDQPGGAIGPSQWRVTTEYLLELFGDPDGTMGRARLRVIMLTALGVAATLPYAATRPGDPVVTDVTFLGSGGYSPAATGQKRYIAQVTVMSHPDPTVFAA
jgi:hypothetical protein